MKESKISSLFTGDLMHQALGDSFVKLNPALMIKNPVMFTVEIGTFIMLIVTVLSAFLPTDALGQCRIQPVITILLLLTVLFANFAEAIAEARGKAQADSLRKTRRTPKQTRLKGDGIKRSFFRSAEKRRYLYG